MAKGKEADEQLKDEALESGPPAGKKKKLLFMIVGLVAVLVLAGGGAAVWLLMTPADGKEHKEAAKEEPQAPIYEKLETFTVNLSDKESYLQVELALKLANPEVQAKVKTYMPEVRDVLLRLLSSKSADELTTQEGKDKLATEIQLQVNEILEIKEPGKGVKGVLFNSFIIQ